MDAEAECTEQDDPEEGDQGVCGAIFPLACDRMVALHACIRAMPRIVRAIDGSRVDTPGLAGRH